MLSHYINIVDGDKLYEIEKNLEDNNYKISSFNSCLGNNSHFLSIKSINYSLSNNLYFNDFKIYFNFSSSFTFSVKIFFYMNENKVFDMSFFLSENQLLMQSHEELNNALIIKLIHALNALEEFKEKAMLDEKIDEVFKHIENEKEKIDKVYSSLLELSYLLKIEDKVDIFSIKIEELIKIAEERVDSFENKKTKFYLLQFLNLSLERQRQIINYINYSLNLARYIEM